MARVCTVRLSVSDVCVYVIFPDLSRAVVALVPNISEHHSLCHFLFVKSGWYHTCNSVLEKGLKSVSVARHMLYLSRDCGHVGPEEVLSLGLV